MPFTDQEKSFFRHLSQGPMTVKQLLHYTRMSRRELGATVQKFTDHIDAKGVGNDMFYDGELVIYRVKDMPNGML